MKRYLISFALLILSGNNALFADNANPKMIQILSAEQLKTYRAFVKTINIKDKRLKEILNDEDTLLVTDDAMPPAYQDSTDDDHFGPFRNDADKPNFVAPLFEGRTFKFPFGQTGGLHQSPTMKKFNFLHLPKVNGKMLPIVYYKKTTYPSTRNGRSSYRLYWLFPKGTVAGEVLWHQGPNESFTFEIRTEERDLAYWERNAFSLFPTSESAAAAIKQIRPNWKEDKTLLSLIRQLEDPTTLKASVVEDTFGIFSASGGIDVLPEELNEAMAIELYNKFPLESRRNKNWKKHGDLISRAPTPNPKVSFSLRPQGDLSYPIAVNSTSCANCHREIGRPFSDLVPRAVLYGEIWGNDEVFFFHPWAPENLLTNAGEMSDNRMNFRREFVEGGIFQAYDPKLHSTEYYQVIKQETWPYEYNDTVSYRNGFSPFTHRQLSGVRNPER
jgi:hypothetical protein